MGRQGFKVENRGKEDERQETEEEGRIGERRNAMHDKNWPLVVAFMHDINSVMRHNSVSPKLRVRFHSCRFFL